MCSGQRWILWGTGLVEFGMVSVAAITRHKFQDFPNVPRICQRRKSFLFAFRRFEWLHEITLVFQHCVSFLNCTNIFISDQACLEFLHQHSEQLKITFKLYVVYARNSVNMMWLLKHSTNVLRERSFRIRNIIFASWSSNKWLGAHGYIV